MSEAKRYYNEETTLDYAINGFKVRVWIVNPFQKNEYTVEQLAHLVSGLDRTGTDWDIAERIVEAVAKHYSDIAAVQVIRPDGVGHMVYTTEYNGDKLAA